MIPFNDFKKLDIKVGRILDATPHPKADKLLVLKIDIGDETRTIVAGIKNYYKREDLMDKKVIVITNLEQRELRGIKSEGMILAAVKDDKVILLTPDEDIKEGAVVQ
ncbi:MAG: methionine--tRNA ligase subunit beta [Nanoarchaeota archaeon]